MAESKIKAHMEELKVLKSHIAIEDLEVGSEYHVPPFLSIKRMDIVVTGKEGNIIKFKITSDSNSKVEKTMDKTCILTRFLVKNTKY